MRRRRYQRVSETNVNYESVGKMRVKSGRLVRLGDILAHRKEATLIAKMRCTEFNGEIFESLIRDIKRSSKTNGYVQYNVTQEMFADLAPFYKAIFTNVTKEQFKLLLLAARYEWSNLKKTDPRRLLRNDNNQGPNYMNRQKLKCENENRLTPITDAEFYESYTRALFCTRFGATVRKYYYMTGYSGSRKFIKPVITSSHIAFIITKSGAELDPGLINDPIGLRNKDTDPNPQKFFRLDALRRAEARIAGRPIKVTITAVDDDDDDD